MNEFKDKVNEITREGFPNRHSFFQLNFFVLGKEPTHQAKLKKCIDEIRYKEKSLTAMEAEIEEVKDNILLLRLSLRNASFSDYEEQQIKTRMVDRKIVANERRIEELQADRISLKEEMLFFMEAFDELSKKEPPKHWDDLEVQMEYWNAKLFEDINHRLLMRLPLDVETVKTALSLPGESKVKKQLSLLLLQSQKKLVDN